MCVENTPPPSGRLTRRGVLAGAAALAGTSAVLAGTAPAASASPGARHGEAPGRGGDLVVEGGRLLDPATGEVTEDAVVVIAGGVVRAAGSRGRVGRIPGGVPVLRAHGQWILPGLVDAHIH
ncbi:amidohydrolase, partial [Streptomyces sp. SID4931]|nr:amidohydrolase [Streptomyces sp. SID4931]